MQLYSYTVLQWGLTYVLVRVLGEDTEHGSEMFNQLATSGIHHWASFIYFTPINLNLFS